MSNLRRNFKGMGRGRTELAGERDDKIIGLLFPHKRSCVAQ